MTKKTIINLSSPELAQRVVKFKQINFINLTLHHLFFKIGGYCVAVRGHSSRCTISRSYFHDGDGAIIIDGIYIFTLDSC